MLLNIVIVFCALLSVLGPVSGWGSSRFDTGGMTPPITCGGAIMSAKIRETVRGENPDVPVTLIARFPMLNPFAYMLSNIHVWSAIGVLLIIYVQLLMPKGTSSHVFLGTVLKYGLLSHFLIIGWMLNIFAISMNVKDWELAPPLSDWRAQVAYIIPFGITTTVAAILGFFLHRSFPFASSASIPLLKGVSLFSIAFFCTIGLYMCVDQMLGGLGNFGVFDVPGSGRAQAFFRPMSFVLFAVGSTQAGLDYVNYKVLTILERDQGNKSIKWVEQHKWGVFVFCYQATVIFATFMAYFPYCLFGFPEWTCIRSPVFAVPFMGVFMLPLTPQFPWVREFVGRVLYTPADKVDFPYSALSS